MHLSTYHPQGNGNVERLHKTMTHGLSLYVNSKGTNWDDFIPLYLMAYSVTPHRTGRYNPYYLHHYRDMIVPTSQDHMAKWTSDVRETEYDIGENT
jgi:hypothetical protein